MNRVTLWLSIVVSVAGCQSGPFGLWGPYGATRIPPPATGSIGRADPYYRPGAPGFSQPSASTTSAADPSSKWDSLRTAANQVATPGGVAKSTTVRAARDDAPAPVDELHVEDQAGHAKSVNENLPWRRPDVSYLEQPVAPGRPPRPTFPAG